MPSLWEQETFIKKAGSEILNQMYAFEDKKGFPICLIPEATALIQDCYNKNWAKEMKKPVRVFYEARCYRYDRPQKGRYREFMQFGVEILGGDSPVDKEELIDVLYGCLDTVKLKDYCFYGSVKRGLDYYVEDGFEVEVDSLGEQKQVIGGGRYKEGIGFAIGIERLIMGLV